jgi:hypothetical protein
MWIRIRAVIVEDEPLASEYLATLLDDTYQVEVIATATDSETGLQLCAELRPAAVFVDINLPGKDGVSLASDATGYASTAATLGLHYGNARHCHKVRLQSEPRWQSRMAGLEQPAGAHQAGSRRVAEAPEHRLDRSVLPAPR